MIEVLPKHYTVYLTKPFERVFKKLPLQVQEHIEKQLFKLEIQPQLGSRLEGKSRFLHSFHLKFANVQYRVIYQINGERAEIYLHYVATRENFCAELERLHLKKNA
jgi:mRNA-degrading endonuclease RelE of RelBE toxin-antitoxin system